MGIADKDLGKYKRPGIFINEIDNSIVELPVQDVLINLVPGFSKKGPINKPVYVTNTVDFQKIFGGIDKGLERKGSYFHRTCIKMLQTGPIWALNLLSTNDTRDKLSYKSISVGSAFSNAATKLMPYSRVFNRQDFWERDPESFLDYVNDPTPDTDRLLHITNMGQKTITVFMYKSSISGFDVTAENWYGGITKVPAYINSKDWMSDYIISVLVLEGEWTDYKNLTVDTTWGKYFTSTGLDKTKVQDFVNEVNVTTLAYYDVSLIPYFKDISGRDMYIKSVINNGTDKTGLYCTYNEDVLLDADYPTGKMDLIGDGLVGQTATSIDFLSYQESITESLTYPQASLDSHGNVFGNYDLTTDYVTGKASRSADNTNWYVNGATIGSTGSTLYLVDQIRYSSGASWFTLPQGYDPTTGTIAQYHVPFALNDAVYLNQSYMGLSANTAYYISNITDGDRWVSLSTSVGGPAITISNVDQTPTNLYLQRINIALANLTNSTFNLGGTAYTFNTGTTNTKIVFEPLHFDDLTSYGYERYDVVYLTEGNNADVQILKGTQGNNSNATPPEFTLDYNNVIILGYVKHTILNGVTPTSANTNHAVATTYYPVTLDNSGYVRLTDIVMSGYTSNQQNYVKFTFGNTSGLTSVYTNYKLLRYRAAYNEIESYLSESKGVIINRLTGYKKYIINPSFTDYSSQYNASFTINVDSDSYTSFYSGGDFLLYYLDNEFMIDNTNPTDRLITTLAPIEELTGSGQTGYAGVIGKYSNVYLDYYNGVINNGDFGYQYNISGTTATKIYMKTWFQNTDKLYIDFNNSDGTSPEPITNWSSQYGSKFIIYSNISNYRQTLEIESLVESKLPNLVYEIKVDKTRYSEIKKGDFIEAYYNESDYAQGGSLYGTDPKKLGRVISTSIDSTNSNWKILKTDVPIKITTITKVGGGADYQTNVYPQIDIYVSTYKGISLTPFTIHADSLPNGTEERQSSILDVMGKTTNLAKGLVNKNKISWRYLVDSFGLGLTSLSKQQYADLCSMKLNCLAFVNAPSAKEFKASSNPSFINDDRTLNTAYIKAGGDETKNPSFLYTFCEGQGRSCVGYFFPYVTVDDSGIPKNVPPAAWIATTYMNKHISSSAAITPWTISAGINNGRVTNIANVEMDLSDEDLENLYAMNLNPIVKKRNAGFCINSESTAQVFPYSSLSVIHSREVLIELENALYDMLLRYQWRFNTPEVRGEIKYKADKICKDLQERDALYNYKNVIDETNNTNYIIDLQMGVLDTYIEIIKGMGIIVNNITILKKGDIESGGFQ